MMIGQYIFVYVIGENEKENEKHKEKIQTSVINSIVQCYNNSWIAFNAFRSDAGSGKQPDILMIDHHLIQKNGFDFLGEYRQSDFFDKEKTKLVILSSAKNLDVANRDAELLSSAKVLAKPLSEEAIEEFI